MIFTIWNLKLPKSKTFYSLQGKYLIITYYNCRMTKSFRFLFIILKLIDYKVQSKSILRKYPYSSIISTKCQSMIKYF